jgi:hypothetical protein
MLSAAALNPKAQGWLRHLWRKATTHDDWSRQGKPHPWWDSYSLAPMLNFARFDLSESSYGLLLMARKTPAWREVYVRILDEMIRRHTTYWAAIDWLTFLGPDPKRANYPKGYRRLIPRHLWGQYDVPGWTANGVEPWGLSPDPIGSDGNLFFRGFFNLMLAIYRDVAGTDTWDKPFDVTGLDDKTFSWSHGQINRFLSDQWAGVWHGPHCENTKVWPFCLAAAGLGLQLSDKTLGTKGHWVVDRWIEDFLTKKCMGYDPRGNLKWVGLYYDPLIDYVHGRNAVIGLFPAIYLLPQNRTLAEDLYRKAVASVGWDKWWLPTLTPRNMPRGATIGLLLAREFGDHTTARRLGRRLEKTSEGKFFNGAGDGDGADDGGGEAEEFGYFYNFGESYPRGQESALYMLAEVMEPGDWYAAFNEIDTERHAAPTVEGVDFPSLGIRQAYNDPNEGVLTVETYAATRSASGTPTRWRVINLPDSQSVAIELNGQSFGGWRAVNANTIEISGCIESQIFRIRTGWTSAEQSREIISDAKPAPRRRRVASVNPLEIVSAKRAVAAGASGCPCCA